MIYVAAALCFISVSVLAATVLGFACSGLTPSLGSASLGFGAIVAVLSLWRERHRAVEWRQLGPWEWAAVGLFALFSLRAFLWLIFRDGDAIKVLSPNNLGDMSLHLTYIAQLAGGAPFWPENPIYAGAKLTYPLGMDLFNALLTVVGIDVIRGLIWVGLAGCVLTGVALWRWGGAFVLAGFLCNGGTFGFDFFREWKLDDYQSPMAWKSIPLALFVTQRGLLFALPAGLALLCSWRTRFFAEGENAGANSWRLPLWTEVLLYASMPLFHLHTFLFLSFVLGVWFIWHARARRELALLVGAALIPATVLVLLVTDRFHGASVLGWQPGWMQNDDAFAEYCRLNFGTLTPVMLPVVFWLTNFGLLPFLVLALCVVLRRERRGLWPAAIVDPALFVFLVCCFVKFAPWEWDNTKLMIWSYLVVLPFLWTHLLVRWSVPVRTAWCFLLFFSGFISLLGGIDARHQGHELAVRSELDRVASAAGNLPQDGRYAGFPTFNHPLLLCGRPMALGYTGHVWSHGLDWQVPAAKVEALMNGHHEWRVAAAELGVRFVFWGAREIENYPDSTQPWRSSAALVANGVWGEIYDLHLTASATELPPLAQ